MHETMVTLTGWIVGELTHRRYEADSRLTRFRMVTKNRRYDRDTATWVDIDPMYLDVECWDRLGDSVAAALRRDDPVIVHGRLRHREYEHEGHKRQRLEVRAESIGRNLRFRSAEERAAQSDGDSVLTAV
ncbi:single-stranded DNA-binding protein [Actinokineospora sp. G85]|uniref:single-stranded DNA-binding protein n=1 Tax=Actinokineospora sp. G85 TaxID=3406626 RepID=UPI003C78BB2E